MKTSHTAAISVAHPSSSVGYIDPQMQDSLRQSITEGVKNALQDLFGPLQQDIRRVYECVSQTVSSHSSGGSSAFGGASQRPSYTVKTPASEGYATVSSNASNLESRLHSLERRMLSYDQAGQASTMNCTPWVRPYMQMFDHRMDSEILSLAIAMYGWPVVEEEMRRSEIDLDVVVKGLGKEFLESFPLKGPQKIRIRQSDGAFLPYFPGKTSITFGWKAGDVPQPERLILRWLTGPRNNPELVFPWVQGHKQQGLIYTCGEQEGACVEVDFPTRKYCSAGPVGMHSYLYLEIEGKQTLTSTLESVTVTIRFADTPRGCGCEACMHGESRCYSGTCVVPG